jgi:hypothetical protein
MILCQQSTLSAGGHVSSIACTYGISDQEPGAERAHYFRHTRIPCSKVTLLESPFEFTIIQEAKYVLLSLNGPPYLEDTA